MQTTIAHNPRLLFLSMLMCLVPALGHGHDRPGASAQVDTARSSHNARLQFLLDEAVWEGLPGVSLRVSGPGVDFQGAAGVADLSTGEPLTTNHVMYTASIGKTFTAAIALQLCDEGRLDLEAPITAWLQSEVTERIPFSEKITLRHLLSHTSGLVDYMNDDTAWRTDFVRDPYRHWTHSDVVPCLYHKPLLFKPGTDYHYSNSNYILVGLIIEKLARQSLHTLVRKRILAPLGMQHTFSGDEAVASEQRAHGYAYRRGRIIDTHPWYSHYGLADSGIHSTPGDLALFIKSLFNTDEILSQTMRTKMTSVSQSVDPPSGYGMGIYVQWNPWGAHHLWYTHDGIDPGYQADMMYLPDLDLTIVLAANASLGKANFIYEKLIMSVVEVALDANTESIRFDDF